MQFERLDWQQRLQHLTMMTSFMICSMTGVPIKFSHAPWTHNIVALYGGFDNMFYFHLFGAALMLSTSLYHVVYLPLTAIMGTWTLEMAPGPKDFVNLAHTMKYFTGSRKKPANFDKYTYIEKFDYWAVFWGMVMIGLTGLMMWFPDVSAKFVPRYIIDIGRVAHSDEAVLAIIVIFIWHFYNVHMNPKFFPASTHWYDGVLPLHELKEEHPAQYAKMLEKLKYETPSVYETLIAQDNEESGEDVTGKEDRYE